MILLQSLIVEARALRKEIGVEEKGSHADRGAHRHVTCGKSSKTNSAIVERLARVN